MSFWEIWLISTINCLEFSGHSTFGFYRLLYFQINSRYSLATLLCQVSTLKNIHWCYKDILIPEGRKAIYNGKIYSTPSSTLWKPILPFFYKFHARPVKTLSWLPPSNPQIAFGNQDLIPLENTSTTTCVYPEYLLTACTGNRPQVRHLRDFTNGTAT